VGLLTKYYTTVQSKETDVEGSLVVAIVSSVISLVSFLVALHYKKLGERDTSVRDSFIQTLQPLSDKVKDMEVAFSNVAKTVNQMQQEISGMRSDLDNVEKDTRRLENSLEKDVKKVFEKIDEIYKMIFSLVQTRRTSE